MKLYELTQNYRNLQELLDDETIPQDEILKALNGLEGQFDEKAENIVKVMKSIDADVKGLKDEEKRLSDRRKSLENRSINLKAYLTDSMRAIGKEKIKGNIFTLAFQKNPPSVDILDWRLIDNEYLIPQIPTVDKKRVLIDLKNGVRVDGVELKQGTSLRIK